MAIPLDTLYLENLEEFIYDEQKFVSFKWLSCKLRVHVNLAKQMLWQFLELEGGKGRRDRLHPLYYLSGRAPQSWISSINQPEQPKKKVEEAPPGSPDLFASLEEEEAMEGEEEGFLVMLCRGEEELAEYRSHFSQLFSLHVYGLSAFPMSKAKLDEFTSVPILDDQGRPPVHYGSITCRGARDYRPDPHIAIRLEQIAQVKAKAAEDKARWEAKEAAEKEERAKAEKMKAKDKKKGGWDWGAKAKEKKQLQVRDKDPEEGGTTSERTKTKVSEDKGKEKRGTTRPKCVIDSDDSEEEEERKVEKESKRKRSWGKRQISSDEDEEEVKPARVTAKVAEDKGKWGAKQLVDKEEEEEGVKGGRKRKRTLKTVANRHVDEEGFLVTVMDQVMVSESDNSEDEKVEPKSSSSKMAKAEKVVSKKEGAAAPKKPPQPRGGKGGGGVDKKQTSLMSFFQKK